MTDIPRESWQRALQALPEAQLSEVVAGFSTQWTIEPLSLPQSGLGLLKLQESTQGEAFYLGEFPLSDCCIRVTTESGVSAEGAARVLDDRLPRAEQLALCDAVLSARLPGWEKVALLVERGEQFRKKIADERNSILARTRVDFSLLDQAGEASASVTGVDCDET